MVGKRGRKTKYSEPLGRAICKMLANGMTLAAVCRRPGMPARPTVIGWASDPKHPFSDMYVRAREIGYLTMADDLTEIADDASNDWMDKWYGENVERVVDKECVMRSKLRIDTRKWLLAKALPKVYGEKVDIKHDATDAFAKLWTAVSTGAAA